MTRSTSHPWFLLLPLLLAFCCCTQPIEEPEDAGSGTNDATDTAKEDTTDTTVDADTADDSDVPTDPETPESERFCDPEYAESRFDQGVLPELQSSCSCQGLYYEYAVRDGYSCHSLWCTQIGWWWDTVSCAVDAGQSEGDPPPDASPDVDAEADTDAAVLPDAPADSE